MPSLPDVRTTLLIPCYNEIEGIPQLCEKLRHLIAALTPAGSIELVFVDDGSTDGTADAIRAEASGLPYRILSHSTNKGLGAALRTGFGASSGEEVVTLDSDCTYDPIQAIDLLQILRQGNDVVTGSPYHPKGAVVNVVGWRLLLSKTLSHLYWLVVPVHLYTYTSCFRAYKRDILGNLDAQDDGFLAVTQLLVSAILKGYKVAEMPACLKSRRFGRSKIRTVRVALSHLRYLSTILLMRVNSDKAPQAHKGSEPRSSGSYSPPLISDSARPPRRSK